MSTALKGAARGTSTSEKSPAFSTGFFAPLNLNFSTSDPLAGFRPSAAAEPWVLIREPLPISDIDAPAPTREGVPTAEALGWPPAFTQNLRSSLESFADDWNHPSMDVYDDAE